MPVIFGRETKGKRQLVITGEKSERHEELVPKWQQRNVFEDEHVERGEVIAKGEPARAQASPAAASQVHFPTRDRRSACGRRAGSCSTMNPMPRNRTAKSGFHSILVPHDLTSASDHLVGRVALLPLAADARLTLLHVVPPGLSRLVAKAAFADARKALADEARSLRRKLPKRAAVRLDVRAGMPAEVIGRLAKATGAELIVMGRGGARGLHDQVLGSTAERTVRRSRFPVLVVRRAARARYHRPLLAIGLDDAARRVIAAALRILPGPRPVMSVVHAYDIPFYGVIYPSLSAREAMESRERFRLQATRDLNRLLADALAQAGEAITVNKDPGWRTHVRHGWPRTVIERIAERMNADLLLLGTHAYAGLPHFLLGTVAGDVLRNVRCDALVVPPD